MQASRSPDGERGGLQRDGVLAVGWPSGDGTRLALEAVVWEIRRRDEVVSLAALLSNARLKRLFCLSRRVYHTQLSLFSLSRLHFLLRFLLLSPHRHVSGTFKAGHRSLVGHALVISPPPVPLAGA